MTNRKCSVIEAWLAKFYREDYTFFKDITAGFEANFRPRHGFVEGRIETYGLEWDEQGERPSELETSSKAMHGN
ncbi:unnamed protein product [Angiostrongylus costaricensis]|uniref:SnoaL-like domain-containing protein n=1 Tax=Angiostrongylus costaricensis TaxID=334426 RepID=A0A0R3PZH4_ANGCS|nr:unnamed protein product [Angiostrongylus costaricensis]